MMSLLSENVVSGLNELVRATTGATAVPGDNNGCDDNNNNNNNNRNGQEEEPVAFAAFNQDTTSLCVGTDRGFRLLSLSSSDHLDQIYQCDDDVLLAERLFSSSLLAVVPRGSPRRLNICHFRRQAEICHYTYASNILAVRMNRARLVVCLEDSLYIHNMSDMKLLHTIGSTPPNVRGLCALSSEAQNCFMAYPGHSTVGQLQIFDALNLSSKLTIPAHASPLAALQLSPSGTLVATASEKGTVLRVFSVRTGCTLYELRRGLKRTAHIYSLAFSPCGHFLAAASNTETVHVFRLEDRPREREMMSQSPPAALLASSPTDWLGYLNTMMSASTISSYLPSQVTDTLLQERAFATVHLNQAEGKKNMCALAMIKKRLRLVVVGLEQGQLSMYSLNCEDGGSCTLIRQFSLSSKETSNASMEGKEEALLPRSTPVPLSNNNSSISYADRVKNREDPSQMTADSEKFHEMRAATEQPPTQCFLLDDDNEFPPVNHPDDDEDH